MSRNKFYFIFFFREEAIRQYQEERRKRREKDESQVSIYFYGECSKKLDRFSKRKSYFTVVKRSSLLEQLSLNFCMNDRGRNFVKKFDKNMASLGKPIRLLSSRKALR